MVPASFSTICPPNHKTAITVTFITIVITGESRIITFIARNPAFFKSPLARRNFSFSWSSRTNDLTTRTLVTFSCTVAFSRSSFSCMAENRGKPRRTKPKIETNSTGIATANTTESDGRMVMAIISAPIIIPGARILIRSIILTKFCTWVTSLVKRVTSEPVENLSIFANEYCCTLRYTSTRISAAKLTDALAPK